MVGDLYSEPTGFWEALENDWFDDDYRKRVRKKPVRKKKPQFLTVRFRKRNGGSFIKRFTSRHTKAKAIVAWRRKGGKIISSY